MLNKGLFATEMVETKQMYTEKNYNYIIVVATFIVNTTIL